MKPLILSILFILSFSIFAQYDFNRVNINGFGTFSYSRSTSDKFYSAFAGRVRDKNNFTSGSRAGITLNKSFDDHWDFTLQLLAKPDADNELSPQVDIFQMSWRPTSAFSIRVGRIRMPLWMISEYYEVGALIPWIRPPDEVYASLPIEELNGLSLSYRLENAGLTTEFDLYGGAGNMNTEGASSIRGELNNAIGSSLSFTYDFLSFRAAYLQGSFAANILKDVLSSSGTPGTSVVTNTRTAFNIGRTHFISLGVKSEFENTLVMSEFANWETSADSFKENQAYYILGGYYFMDKKLLVNFTFAQLTKVDSQIQFYSGRQKSKTIGINYQVSSNLVLKVQDKIVSPDGITFFSSDPGAKDVSIYEIAADFVF